MTIQRAPYLRIQRQFPYEDVKELAVQVDQAYIDIAQKVNARIIGIFSTNFSTATGEQWFLKGEANRQQTLRQVYPFTGAGSIAHGINPASLGIFTRCWGEYTDGANFYGALWTSSVGIAGQVTFYMTTTNIVITVDAGAPAFTSGNIVLEWLSAS
jgi:hypothetical protein